MSMTRKDYEVIAKVIKTHRDAALATLLTDEAAAIEAVAEDLAGEFAVSNPAFKAPKFLKACGID